MNEVIEYDPITGEELEFGCIMRGTPDKNGECSSNMHCPGCDQARRIRAKKMEFIGSDNPNDGPVKSYIWKP